MIAPPQDPAAAAPALPKTSPATSRRLRTAVIGAGYLGSFHARKYANSPAAKLVAVVDTNAAAAARLGAELGVPGLGDYRQLFGKVDAVSLVVPTPMHQPIGCALLQAGIHVLVEKPIATTIAEAQALIDSARASGCVLQVGHLERFNPAIMAAICHLKAPRFIESHRLAPFKQRGTDVSVVLDLLIHDIDLIQHLVGTAIDSIDAVGTSVFSAEIDIVNARLKFKGGCVANTTASRVSLKQERKIRIFQDDAYLSVDMQQKILTVIRKKDAMPIDSPAQVSIEEESFDQGDALQAEIEAFLCSVLAGTAPMVSGEDGLQALRTALRITEMIGSATGREIS